MKGFCHWLTRPGSKRSFPSVQFDADRFSEFYWLVVEEPVRLEMDPEARAVPVLYMN